MFDLTHDDCQLLIATHYKAAKARMGNDTHLIASQILCWTGLGSPGNLEALEYEIETTKK